MTDQKEAGESEVKVESRETRIQAAKKQVDDAKDFYTVLGLSPGESTTSGMIKKAFHQLAILHPDQNKSDPNAEPRFNKILSAYTTLIDPVKRTVYDQHPESKDQQQADDKFRAAKGQPQPKTKFTINFVRNPNNLTPEERKAGNNDPKTFNMGIGDVDLSWLENFLRKFFADNNQEATIQRRNDDKGLKVEITAGAILLIAIIALIALLFLLLMAAFNDPNCPKDAKAAAESKGTETKPGPIVDALPAGEALPALTDGSDEMKAAAEGKQAQVKAPGA